ncbi:hypothetical protein Ctha_1128 [Chloroherpeton thalassium ATCC 35110]|uniref:Uncharacterized protein n=1 Tax=Chloroherpeton thalassium (strain ATCC 35110 / GB-78) TaxID=517418 RepID=B3QYG4_CHLT3|nr:hypothetical protein Ctha_1128 [Chloroherpeton thalassium ATCC 35110]
MTEFFVNDCEEEGFRVVMLNGVKHPFVRFTQDSSAKKAQNGRGFA